MEYIGIGITGIGAVFAFTTGALVKSKKWLTVCIVITVIFAIVGIALMIYNYTEWFNSLGIGIKMTPLYEIPKIMYA